MSNSALDTLTINGLPALDHVHCMDALVMLRGLAAGSVDAVISDFPYNTTACEWETDLALSSTFWHELRRVTKPNCAILTTCSEPFTSLITIKNRDILRHTWVWEKSRATGYLNANRQPMKAHEDIRVFSVGEVRYYPQMGVGTAYRATSGAVGGHVRDKTVGDYLTINNGERYPRSVLYFPSEGNALHPTQKPVALYEYLILTYTQPGDVILDPFIGSGTTAVAAQKLGRHYIGCDISPEYVEMARQRLAMPFMRPLFSDSAGQGS